jgi:ADP-ribose pyrophosphatase YjhB (NUDIX family)
LSRQAIDYVWVIKPSGSYGSSWSLPKGRKDEGSTLEETATREVLEESGLMAKFIPNGYLGSHEGSSSTTHYYLMVQTTGNPLDHDFETEKVLLLKIDDAIALMEKDYNRRDERVLKLAKEKIDLLKSNLGY